MSTIAVRKGTTSPVIVLHLTVSSKKSETLINFSEQPIMVQPVSRNTRILCPLTVPSHKGKLLILESEPGKI